MGVIYELLKLPKKEKEKFLYEVVRQETVERLNAQKGDILHSRPHSEP